MTQHSDGRPDVRVIAENSEADLARRELEARIERAEARLRQAIKELTANLIRVARGTGNPYGVIDHIAAIADAIQAYQSATEAPQIGYVIAQALAAATPERTREGDAFRWETDRAVEQIIRGSLQIAAGRLLAQRLQISASS